MAETNDSSTEPETSAIIPDQRARGRRLMRAASVSTPDVATARAPKPARTAHPVRTFLTVTAVAALVATVTVPAIGSRGADAAEAAVTVQQVAAENAQSLVIASEATPQALDRAGYSATTPEEIQKKKDEEAAKAAAAARIAAAAAAAKASAASGAASSSYTASVPASIAVAGSVVRPLPYFDNFGTPYAGHKGTDYMVGRYTPIYAIADGVVVASSEAGPGWGVYVKIAHNIGGNSVTSLYAHMSYGTRRVQVGETVSAGQLIGQVGDTGRAYGTHLHLEIYVNGAWVYPESWLAANLG